MRPSIVISGPRRGGDVQWWASALAVRRAGGRPVRVTPRRSPPKRFDGLVLGGGADLHTVDAPSRRRLRAAWREAVDPDRDRMEVALLAHALANDLPVLGICRGAQLIDVALGGRLVTDVASFYVEVPHRRMLRPRQRVTITPKSRLARTLGRTEARVNALHDQAIDTLGTDLKIVAKNDHGIVQAIEHAARTWVIGVQWHPELIPHHRVQQRLFDRLVRVAANAVGS